MVNTSPALAAFKRPTSAPFAPTIVEEELVPKMAGAAATTSTSEGTLL